MNFWFSFVFPLCLKRRLQIHQKFSVLRKEKICKTKRTEWHNELKPTENELKVKSYLLTLYLNHFFTLMFGRTLKKLFWFFLFLLRHRKVNLRTLTYNFYQSSTPANINSAAFDIFLKKICVLWHANLLILRSAVTATPLPPHPPLLLAESFI